MPHLRTRHPAVGGRACWALTALAAGAALVAVAMAWPPGQSVAGRRVILNPPVEPRPSPAKVRAFFAAEVEPLIAASAERDRAAAERALATLRERFDAFRAGAAPFAADVAGWGTRFGVLRRSAGDAWDRWWNSKAWPDAVRTYIDAKFRAHVINEETLRLAVEETLEQFRSDLEANRNQLFSEVRARLRSDDAPVALAPLDLAEFERDVQRRAAELLQAAGTDSLVSGVVAFSGGIVAEEAARRLAMAVLSRVAVQLATTSVTTAATGGGATAGGAAVGGAAGTGVGPVGTVIGFGVGMAVGAAIDWWLTARFEERLASECRAFLDRVESELIKGSPQSPGLRRVLSEAIESAHDAQQRAALASLMEVIE